jgi:hypothetical protein
VSTEQQAEPDPAVDAGQSETTAAWMTADRAHLERLIADSAVPKRRRWWRRPLPWLVVRQYQRHEHVVAARRWEWRAEITARWRSRRHATEIGVFYTARHRTHVRKASIDAELIRDERAAKRAES